LRSFFYFTMYPGIRQFC